MCTWGRPGWPPAFTADGRRSNLLSFATLHLCSPQQSRSNNYGNVSAQGAWSSTVSMYGDERSLLRASWKIPVIGFVKMLRLLETAYRARRSPHTYGQAVDYSPARSGQNRGGSPLRAHGHGQALRPVPTINKPLLAFLGHGAIGASAHSAVVPGCAPFGAHAGTCAHIDVHGLPTSQPALNTGRKATKVLSPSTLQRLVPLCDT